MKQETIGSNDWNQLLLDASETIGMKIVPDDISKFAIHAKELLEFNKVTNLTAITNPTEIAIKHFIDSVFVAKEISKRYQSGKIMDAGTGAGFPGIPIAVMLPDFSVTMVESKRKKVSFLKYVIRLQGIGNAYAVNNRIEELHNDTMMKHSFDIIVSRFFSDLPKFIALATPLLKCPGNIIAMKGTVTDSEIDQLKQLNLDNKYNVEIVKYVLPVLNEKRSLVIIKVR